MTQMGRHWWPRLTTSTSTTTRATAVDTLYGGRTTTTRSFTSTSSQIRNNNNNASSSSSCCGLSRLMRKLKRHSNKMLKTATNSTYPSRQSSFQCRYDPLSYALNFDTTGTGSVSDEDYYKFCAFSSRFVATPKGDHCPNLMTATSH
ncbi:uncharacterized protein LOC132048118 [Lycium ferocissimum]|uniref:uncharacterized protein LOC132048118 n=1 Tax=Lycium ferocissimum TaxID=112874 RepID=UPI002815EEB2|nr:uncharacterized protein LOC132048118 [Lycium ferocissimum]